MLSSGTESDHLWYGQGPLPDERGDGDQDLEALALAPLPDHVVALHLKYQTQTEKKKLFTTTLQGN